MEVAKQDRATGVLATGDAPVNFETIKCSHFHEFHRKNSGKNKVSAVSFRAYLEVTGAHERGRLIYFPRIKFGVQSLFLKVDFALGRFKVAFSVPHETTQKAFSFNFEQFCFCLKSENDPIPFHIQRK